MAVIAKLDVLITASAKNFNQGVQKATRGLKNFRSTARQTSGGMRDLANNTNLARAGMVAMGAAVAAAAVKIGRAGIEINKTDQSIKAASRTMGLQVDELDRLQSSMEAVGLQGSTMNTGFREMNRRVAEAIAGTGELRRVFDDYRISADRLEGQLPIDRLKELLMIMQEVKTATGDLGAVQRVARAAFGRTGGDAFLQAFEAGEIQKAFEDIANTSDRTKANMEASALAGQRMASALAEAARERDTLARSLFSLGGIVERLNWFQAQGLRSLSQAIEGGQGPVAPGELPRNEIPQGTATKPTPTAGRNPQVMEYRNIMQQLVPGDLQ